MATTMPHLSDHVSAHDHPENHTTEGPCFSCWCYSCGGRTDRDRVLRASERESGGEHTGDPSHRWCFE